MMLLISTVILPNTTPVQAEGEVGSAEDIVASLSKEERHAIKQLQKQTGFTVHPDINQESTADVDVIVEFKQDPAKVAVKKSIANHSRHTISLESAEADVESSHKAFNEAIQHLQKEKTARDANPEVEITHEYRDALNGVSMTLPGTMIEPLVETGLIEHVWQNETVGLDLPDVETSSEELNAEPFMEDSIPQIGVDRLHDEGITGEGIDVGVIDTGIDYNHPDLENAYKGYRGSDDDATDVDPTSVKGWDFVDGDADPMESTYQDWLDSGQPEFDQVGNSHYTTHGTHVSGTIAGQNEADNDHAVKGVAPDVNLYTYRVLGPYGTGDMAWVIAGIDKAVNDGMDVINLSLGVGTNDALSPSSIAVNNATLSGVVSAVAAGNAGPSPYSLGSPGASAFAITVGASDVSQSIPTYHADAGDYTFDDIELLGKNFSDSIEDLQDNSYEMVFAGLGDSDDYDDIDVTGKIALVERGVITFDEKMRNAHAVGAEAIIVYNNEEGQIPDYIGESTDYATAFRVSDEAGEKLKAVASESDITFGALTNIHSEGDYLAEFSSRGPVGTSYDIKPEIVAPGVAIYSTVPSYVNDPEGDSYDAAYARMNGTSMASPHVAGAVALVLQANPDYDPFEVKAALMNSAVEMAEEYSVYEMGAGRMNVYDAAHLSTSIQVLDETEMVEGEDVVDVDNVTGSMNFGSFYAMEEESIQSTKQLAFINNESDEQTYTSSVNFLTETDSRNDAAENGVTLSIDDSITVPAGERVETEAVIEVPSDAAHGTYEGYVDIENNQGDMYSIPFAVRATGKGIDFVDLDRPAVPNEWEFHPFLNPFISMGIQVSNPMETVDILIKDSETNEPIGYIGQLEDFEPDTSYTVTSAFMGVVQPFTGDPDHPIAEEELYLDEGDYIFSAIATDENGDTYTVDQPVVVDNTPPEMSYKDYEPGVIEVDDSMFTVEDDTNALWVHANVYDDTIDFLNKLDFDYDQSENIVGYYQDSPYPGRIAVEANGDLKFGLAPEELEDGPVSLDLLPVDLATNADFSHMPQYFFVQEDDTYSQPAYSKDSLYLGDTFTMTLNLNNVEDFLGGNVSVEYINELFEFTDVKVSEDFQAFADENDVDITVDEPSISDDLWLDTVSVGAVIDNKDALEGATGDMDFLDLTFELIGDQFFDGSISLNVEEFTYVNGETEENNVPVFTSDALEIVPKASTVVGFIEPEAFLDESGGFLINMDFEGLGAKVYAQSKSGETFSGMIENDGSFEIKSVPVSEEAYDIYVEVPGHLATKVTTQLGGEQGGELVGQIRTVTMGMNAAGDINGDGVIDIMDVMRLVGQYNSESDQADLNKDGMVDEIDARFIEHNFMQRGADANDKEPIADLGGKGLYDLFQSIGLEPADD